MNTPTEAARDFLRALQATKQPLRLSELQAVTGWTEADAFRFLQAALTGDTWTRTPRDETDLHHAPMPQAARDKIRATMLQRRQKKAA